MSRYVPLIGDVFLQDWRFALASFNHGSHESALSGVRVAVRRGVAPARTARVALARVHRKFCTYGFCILDSFEKLTYSIVCTLVQLYADVDRLQASQPQSPSQQEQESWACVEHCEGREDVGFQFFLLYVYVPFLSVWLYALFCL